MLKTKLMVVFGVLIGSAVLSTGGLLAWHEYKHGTTFRSFDTMQSTAAAVGDSNAQGSASNQEAPSNDLSVGSSTASGGLGQLSSGQSASSSSNTTATNPSSTAPSETAVEKALDPTTFGQYNDPKYLDASSAFFADLEVGTGTEIAAGQQVEVYYKGWLTNGQLFDESKTGSNGQLQPFTFTYGANPSQVIAGWEQGLAGMKVGGVRLLIIPPAVGYGAAGQGSIPGNSVLIFQVQLAAVQ